MLGEACVTSAMDCAFMRVLVPLLGGLLAQQSSLGYPRMDELENGSFWALKIPI